MRLMNYEGDELCICYSRMSHCSPVNPGKQEQLKDVRSEEQRAPFLHGSLAQKLNLVEGNFGGCFETFGDGGAGVECI